MTTAKQEPSATESERPASNFDPETLRARYSRERRKRLRSDANDQYVEVKGTLARFADDPWVEGVPAREPLTDDVDVALIGGAFGGLLAGARLRQWGDGVRTLHGIHIHGFPNCFMMSIAQSGFTVNFPYMINEQAKHIAYVIHRALEKGITALEVTEQAEAEWVEAVIERSSFASDFAENCTPGCYNDEGQPAKTSRQNGFYFGGPTEFVELLEQWRADGEMKGLRRR